MKKLMSVSIIIIVSLLLLGSYMDRSQNRMIRYIESYGYDVVSFNGETEVTSDQALYENIMSVQYNELDAAVLEVHRFRVVNDIFVEASLIIIDGEIVGGYAISKYGDMYSLDLKIGLS